MRVDGVEVPCRLVRDEHVGLSDDSACDGDTLLLAAGELARETPNLVGETDEFEHMRHVGLDVLISFARHFESKGDVFVHVFGRQKAKILKDSADVAAERAKFVR